ncbi:MAG: DUF3604 domain-containing protein [Methyloprofundus sp.]|nr:DUF3604 domain-containing protein [Methyloprofundus sp.]
MKLSRALVPTLILAAFKLSSASAMDAVHTDPSIFKGKAYSPYANRSFPAKVLFGDVHVHTGLSGDAGGGGTRLMPRDAYRFARGEQVISNTGQPVRISQPYDFMAVADHTDGMGMITDVLAGAPNIMAEPYGRELNAAFNAGGEAASKAMFGLIARFSQGKIPTALNYQPGNPAYRSTWEGIVQAAEDYNEPGKFTTLIGFEWTSLVQGNNLHRVVLMRDNGDKAMMIEPYTTTPPLGSPNPRDLWKWMENWEAKTGGRMLAVPHNGNLSNGWMFPLLDKFDKNNPLDKAYLKNRARWEPLVEVTQPKGDGEAHPLLSPDDEFADFETWDAGNLDLSQAKTPDMLLGEYARSALKRGLELDAQTGINPYKFGMIGSTDIHTALSTTSENNWFGKHTADEPKPGRAKHLAKENKKLGLKRFGWEYQAAGVVAVWAQDNTRGDIFDAMQRKETYATTGPRIRVRFFGGFDFTAADAYTRQPAVLGYSKGVPMGGDLHKAAQGKAPTFLVAAMKDPQSGNLDRIQIIKGWLDAKGKAQERIYNVAWSDTDSRLDSKGKLAAVGNSVDAKTATWKNTIGEAELISVWKDPDFNPAVKAFYYARVLEIPTPRWTTYDAVYFNEKSPKAAPVTIQERAYTSPIWYEPKS